MNNRKINRRFYFEACFTTGIDDKKIVFRRDGVVF